MVSGIGAVSSLGSTMSSVQPLSAQTRSELEKLGINASNIKTEAQGQEALKSAQSSQNSQESNSSQNTDKANKASTQAQQPSQGQGPTWISLMEQNGISPTGSIDGDKAAVKAALANMDPAQAKSLASQFQAAGLSVTASEDSKQSDSQQKDAFAGQNQIAELNKFFLVKN